LFPAEIIADQRGGQSFVSNQPVKNCVAEINEVLINIFFIHFDINAAAIFWVTMQEDSCLSYNYF
jgi:hypothetical protein